MSDGRNTSEASQVLITPGKEITASTIDAVKQEIAGQVHDDTMQVRLDLKNVEVIDSMGLSLLIGMHTAMQSKGGELLVMNTPWTIFELIKDMRLDKHMNVHVRESEDES